MRTGSYRKGVLISVLYYGTGIVLFFLALKWWGSRGHPPAAVLVPLLFWIGGLAWLVVNIVVAFTRPQNETNKGMLVINAMFAGGSFLIIAL